MVLSILFPSRNQKLSNDECNDYFLFHFPVKPVQLSAESNLPLHRFCFAAAHIEITSQSDTKESAITVSNVYSLVNVFSSSIFLFHS